MAFIYQTLYNIDVHIYEQRERREREREGHTLKNVAIFDRRPTNLKASDFDANTHAHRDPVNGKDPGYHLDMYNKILYIQNLPDFLQWILPSINPQVILQ